MSIFNKIILIINDILRTWFIYGFLLANIYLSPFHNEQRNLQKLYLIENASLEKVSKFQWLNVGLCYRCHQWNRLCLLLIIGIDGIQYFISVTLVKKANIHLELSKRKESLNWGWLHCGRSLPLLEISITNRLLWRDCKQNKVERYRIVY